MIMMTSSNSEHAQIELGSAHLFFSLIERKDIRRMRWIAQILDRVEATRLDLAAGGSENLVAIIPTFSKEEALEGYRQSQTASLSKEPSALFQSFIEDLSAQARARFGDLYLGAKLNDYIDSNGVALSSAADFPERAFGLRLITPINPMGLFRRTPDESNPESRLCVIDRNVALRSLKSAQETQQAKSSFRSIKP